ncbi:MAG: hypothetical protein JNM43_00385 [Planctomycetaceae bacterium]|nr:hypothetical protein [Planctomycetaceae bacterium]
MVLEIRGIFGKIHYQSMLRFVGVDPRKSAVAEFQCWVPAIPPCAGMTV